jgi:MFS family permease
MVRIWGPLTDRFGNKPVILICGWGLVGVPLAWLFVRSTSDLVPLAVAHLATGAFTAGVALSQTNILVKLAPRARRSVYLAVSAATSGTLGALGPLSGGFLIEALGPFALRRGAIQLSDLHVAFFVSSALQIVFLCLWKHIEEAGAVSPGMVLAQLRDDLALLARGSTRSLS